MDSRIATASRVAAIEPFHVMEVQTAARALEAAGRSIVHMEIGEPDFPTPAPVPKRRSARSPPGTSTRRRSAFRAGGAITRHYAEHLGVAIAGTRDRDRRIVGRASSRDGAPRRS
jgi:aspartate/methionine/tyrosine aminotransferase